MPMTAMARARPRGPGPLSPGSVLGVFWGVRVVAGRDGVLVADPAVTPMHDPLPTALGVSSQDGDFK